jgi:aspartate beta-hydroxylase
MRPNASKASVPTQASAPAFASWEAFVEWCLGQLEMQHGITRSAVTTISDGFILGRSSTRNRRDSLRWPPLLFPNLPSTPWHDPAAYDWAGMLENGAADIRQELNDIIERGLFRPHPELPALAEAGNWEEFRFFAKGKRNEENCQACPRTAALVGQVPGASSAGSVFFAALGGGTHIVPHCGPHNLRIRGHLGLLIPTCCEMRVGNETRSWTEGRMLIFDDSFEHEVWNRSSATRFVLLLDVWHPLLTREEITAFRFLDQQLSLLSSEYASTGRLPEFAS